VKKVSPYTLLVSHSTFVTDKQTDEQTDKRQPCQ